MRNHPNWFVGGSKTRKTDCWSCGVQWNLSWWKSPIPMTKGKVFFPSITLQQPRFVFEAVEEWDAVMWPVAGQNFGDQQSKTNLRRSKGPRREDIGNPPSILEVEKKSMKPKGFFEWRKKNTPNWDFDLFHCKSHTFCSSCIVSRSGPAPPAKRVYKNVPAVAGVTYHSMKLAILLMACFILL